MKPSDLRTGDVVFIGNNTCLHIWGRCFNPSRAFHTGIAVRDAQNQLFFLHAEGAKYQVSLWTWKKAMNEYRNIGDVYISCRILNFVHNEDREAFEKRFREYIQEVLGTPYESLRGMLETICSCCCFRQQRQEAFLCCELVIDAYVKTGLVSSEYQEDYSSIVTADLTDPSFPPMKRGISLSLTVPLLVSEQYI